MSDEQQSYGKAFRDAHRDGFFQDLTSEGGDRSRDEDLWLAHCYTNQLPLIGLTKQPAGVALYVNVSHCGYQPDDLEQIEEGMKAIASRPGRHFGKSEGGFYIVGPLPRRLARKEARQLADRFFNPSR